MADVFLNGQPTLTTSGSAGTTAPGPGTSEGWSVAALSAAFPSLSAEQVIRLIDPAQPAEIIAITACTGSGATSITVTRGAESTTPVAHATAATFCASIVTAASLTPSGLGAAPTASPAFTGSATFTPTTSEAVLGSEMISATNNRTFAGAGNWSGTNWSVSGGVLTHTAGSNPVSLPNANLTAAPVAGTAYAISFDVTTTTAGVLTPSFGGISSGSISITLATSGGGTFTVTRSAGSFITDGFAVDQNVNLSGFTNAVNNGTFQIQSLTTTVLTLVDLVGVVSEGPVTGTVATTTGIAVGQTVGTLTGQRQIINATGAGPFAFQPDATWAGSIDNVSVKLVTPTSAAIQLLNQDGSAGPEGRAGGSNVGNNMQNSFLGYQAGLLVPAGPAQFNAGFGAYALASLLAGMSNTALGNVALASVTDGSNNTAVGDNALAALTTGNGNNGQGAEVLGGNVFGSYNTAMGENAAQFQVGGDYNTAVGAFALLSAVNAILFRNVALGAFAGKYETGNDHLWIDNQDRGSLTAAKSASLVYGLFDASAANQWLQVNGRLDVLGMSQATVTKTANYTLTNLDSVVLADATSGSITQTLPTAAGKTGQTFTVKKKDSSGNTVTVATTGGQTIDGQSSWVLSTQYFSITVVSDGANWYRI